MSLHIHRPNGHTVAQTLLALIVAIVALLLTFSVAGCNRIADAAPSGELNAVPVRAPSAEIVGEEVAVATEAVNLTIRENREVVRETLQNIDRITQKGGPELQQILVNVRVITEDVKQMLAAQGGKDGQ